MSTEPYRILIIDDNPDDRAEIRRLLLTGSERRYKFTEAESGKSGIVACLNSNNEQPDCVILDFHLPDMNAVEVLSALSVSLGLPVCPVVVLTGGTGVELGRDVLRAGAQDYIGKDWITPPVLTRAIDNATERWKMALELRHGAIALRESERRFRGVFDSSFQYFGLIAPDGTVLEMNQTALDSAGIAAHEVLGQPLWKTIWWAHDGILQSQLCKGIERAAAGEFVRFEASHPLVNGTYAVIDFSLSPIRDEHDNVVLLVPEGRDVTAWKQTEQMLQEADRRKDEFLATLAHELRNPLAPVRSGLEVLRLTSDPHVAKTIREMMGRQLGQLVRLIDDLMDVSRITSGKMMLRHERLSLQVLAETAVETVKPLIDASGHTLHLEFPNESIWIDADSTRLAQVISNILTNSAKYTPDGGQIWLTISRDQDEAIITIRDTGLGIPAEMLSKVFEMFAQVNRTLDRAQGGLGIGLALVRQLVQMHGGTITVESNGEGQGSNFTVRLPINSSELSSSMCASPRVARSGISHRVLVVDDNADAAGSLAMTLKMMGNDVRIAPDGPEGIEIAEAFRPEMILLDIGMPKVNGFDTCRIIRELPWSKGMVIVAVTGWGQELHRQRSCDAGFDKHVVKPVELGKLEELLASLESDSP